MHPELNIGVIGVNGRGKLARLAHKPEEGSRLVGGADTCADFLKEFGEATGAPFLTDDYRELVEREEIDAIFVCSPDYLHEEHALACLSAGKSVYLEKPMAITVEGCDRILETARACNAKLYLGHNMRHMPFVRRMKQIIDDGLIGEVKTAWCRHFVGYGGDFYFKDWHADRRNSTGLLLQKGSHDLDVLHWLCGGFTERVSGMGALTLYDQIDDRDIAPAPGKRDWSKDNWPPLKQKGLNPVIDVEDLSMVQMHLDNGVFCSYQQCHYTPDYWRNYTVIGTEGRMENFGNGGGDTVIKVWNRRTDYDPEGDIIFRIPETEQAHGGADPYIVKEFLEYARNGGRATTSPVAARYSIAAACAATDSIRNGSKPCDVQPLAPDLIDYFERLNRGDLTRPIEALLLS